MKLNRRHLLKITGASAALCGTHTLAQTTSNPDVVILGAGAAGIAAAQELRAAGISFLVLEATNRVGGRAFTESATFGVPFDHGAHWVQNGRRNRYFNIANQLEGRFYKAPEEYKIFAEKGFASRIETEQLWLAYDDAIEAISTAGRQRKDVAPSEIVSSENIWSKTAGFAIGPWEMGKDMTDFSCLDWWNSADSEDWYYGPGYGRLVADYAAGLPVVFNTPATRIDWSGPDVRVETATGAIRTQAVIVTASTGVLANEGISFTPALPVEKQQSFHDVPMGNYNHIALLFSEDIFGMGEDGYLLHKVSGSGEAFGALTNASGTGLAYCDVGGSFARDLEAAGHAVAADFVVMKLRQLIGSDVDRYLVSSAVTSWGKNEFVRGCYASAKPGAYLQRDVLRQSVGDRIFFAGEACHDDLWATVGGADRSGSDTALAVIRKLRLANQ